jgi:hypothetical protein
MTLRFNPVRLPRFCGRASGFHAPDTRPSDTSPQASAPTARPAVRTRGRLTRLIPGTFGVLMPSQA